MPILAATNLHYSIGQTVLLDGMTLSIEPGERVGLVGRNGCGKTSFMKVLSGAAVADSGLIVLQRGARVGYLSQDPDLDPAKTLREEAGSAFVELARLHGEQDKVFHQMEVLGNDHGPEMERLMNRHAALDKQIEAAGGYAVDHKIDAILHGLGFSDAQFTLKVSVLSGGQKGRLALAKLLLDNPDLVLLDEPTNHLDIPGREWLEDFLKNEYRGAVLMVSHDRYMLDNVVTRIVEVEQGRLIEYPGNYTAFVELRAERRLAQFRAYENQQTKFKAQEAYIRRYKAGQRAKQAKGRETRLEREKRDSTLERPVELGAMALQLPKAPRSGDLVVVVREASKKYTLESARAVHNSAPVAEGDEGWDEGFVQGEKVLFRELTVTIGRGERWGIIGPNGAGKTTLVRAMLGQVPIDSGTTKVGANVVIGYYSQLADEIDPTLNVWQYLQRVIKKENPAITGAGFSEQQARNLAGAFLFSGPDQDKLLGVLSGGEKSRARLAGLLASAKNLLILDEPTNHLDISAAERLEDALALPDEESGDDGFEGTLLLISHDRALIDATCDHLLILDGHGGVEVFHGTYADWHQKQIDRKKEEARAAAEAERQREAAAKAKAKREAESAAAKAANGHAKPGSKGASPKKPGGGGGGGKGGLSWMSADRLEAELEKANTKAAELDALLQREDVYQDRQRFTQLLDDRAKVQTEQTRLEEEWLRRADS